MTSRGIPLLNAVVTSKMYTSWKREGGEQEGAEPESGGHSKKEDGTGDARNDKGPARKKGDLPE